MFVFLSKFLPLFVYPVGLTCILILLALALRGKPRAQKILLILTLILLFISGNRWVKMSVVRSLEWRYLHPESLPEVEVIVVLGGGTEPRLYPRSMPELNSAGDRLLYAAYLYKQGKAPHLLLTSGKIEWMNPGETGAASMAVVMEMMGVPREAIWLETTSENTHDNAVNSRKILQEKGIERIILVTSALHMPRSVALFERQGFEVIPAPTDFSVTQATWQQSSGGANLAAQLIYLLPTADNISDLTNALKEYLGIVIYRLRGWL